MEVKGLNLIQNKMPSDMPTGSFNGYTIKDIQQVFRLNRLEIAEIAKKNNFHKKYSYYPRSFYVFLLNNYAEKRFECWK